MVQACDKNASWAPSFGGLLGASNCEWTPGYTQNSLDRLHITHLAWERLVIPQEQLENVGEGYLEYPA